MSINCIAALAQAQKSVTPPRVPLLHKHHPVGLIVMGCKTIAVIDPIRSRQRRAVQDSAERRLGSGAHGRPSYLQLALAAQHRRGERGEEAAEGELQQFSSSLSRRRYLSAHVSATFPSGTFISRRYFVSTLSNGNCRETTHVNLFFFFIPFQWQTACCSQSPVVGSCLR